MRNFVLHGRSSENFKRFKTIKQIEIDCSFSIVLDTRTIDLEAPTLETKEAFIKGLQLIFLAF